MAGLDSVYELVDDGTIEILDHFENSDFLTVQYSIPESGAVIFNLTCEYPNEKIILDSQFDDFNNSYISEMLSIFWNSHLGNENLMSETIKELTDRLIPELEQEKVDIEKGKERKAEIAKEKSDSEEKPRHTKPKKLHYNTKPEEPNQKPNKKIKMKTVTDVVNRIIWDEDLDHNDFTVGYIDRFTGLKEKPFEDFSWKNPVDIDYWEEFGVPQHRIVYFKWKEHVVWDKETRKDFVFGSGNGKGIAIHDFIAEQNKK